MLVATNMRALLMQAWRERWSDTRWNVEMNKFVNTPDDVDQMTELLLEQSLVGCSPNRLMLHYIKHAIATMFIPLPVFIRHLAKRVDVSQPLCLIALLDLITAAKPDIGCCLSGDMLEYACTLMSIVGWLLELVMNSLSRLTEHGKSADLISLINKSTCLASQLFVCTESKGLILIGRLENSELYGELCDVEADIRCLLPKLPASVLQAAVKEKINAMLKDFNSLESLPAREPRVIKVSHDTMNVTFHTLLTLEVILKPTNDVAALSEMILMLATAQNIGRPQLYTELLRSSFLLLSDTHGTVYELPTTAFVYLKLPRVLQQVSEQSGESDKGESMYEAVSRFLGQVTLLDHADSIFGCNVANLFLPELNRVDLLTEAQVMQLQTKRQNSSGHLKAAEPLSPTQQPNVILILRADGTVSSVLKTLYHDYTKSQDSLLNVLCHMMSGKSFDLILAAAAAKDKLQQFVFSLVRFNELSRQPPVNESTEAAQTRVLLFDISFLMLCHIHQHYGQQTLSSDSFFFRWMSSQSSGHTSMNSSNDDGSRVDTALTQLHTEFNPQGAHWDDICLTLPLALREVLVAHESDAFSWTQVQAMLDKVKGKFCFMVVVMTTWLCQHINMIGEQQRHRALRVLRYLLEISPGELGTQPFQERWSLMKSLNACIVCDVLPDEVARPPHLPQKHKEGQALGETLLTSLKEIHSSGMASLDLIQKIYSVLVVSGEKFFCKELVKEMLSQDRQETLHLYLGLTFAVFSMNFDPLALSLFTSVLPSIMQDSACPDLIDMKGRSLARLCALCLEALYKRVVSKEPETSGSTDQGRKRTYSEVDNEDLEGGERPAKLRRLPGGEEAGGESFSLADLHSSSRKNDEVPPIYGAKLPIKQALSNLMHIFARCVNVNEAGPRVGFIMALLEEVVNLGPDVTRFLLPFIPAGMIKDLSRISLGRKDVNFYLALCDLSSQSGRRLSATTMLHLAIIRKMRINDTPWPIR